ncbi:MAG: alanine racemase [Bacteroidota bacterium]
MFKKPVLIIQPEICKKNISKMIDKAKEFDLQFRPHFKTHQSVKIANWFREKGVNKITVSSVSMARYFINDNWKDITIAFPFNINETIDINKISSDISINLVVESEFTLKYLVNNLIKYCGIYIKINTGYNRTGLEINDYYNIDKLINRIASSKNLEFKGFLTHAGDAYSAKNQVEILTIGENIRKELSFLKMKYINQFPELIISYGDTPSTSLMNDFTGIDEIRPGNFVFYDSMQLMLQTCKFNQIAIALVCPVVSINKKRNEVVIYGGAVHLSKEYIPTGDGLKNFGLISKLNNDYWSEPIENTFIKSLSQEHGIIQTDEINFKNFNIGDFVAVIPVHICLTANLMGEYFTFSGEKLDHFSKYHLHSL